MSAFERCERHGPKPDMNMVASHEDALIRVARGEKQKRCPECLLWLWPDEWEVDPNQPDTYR